MLVYTFAKQDQMQLFEIPMTSSLAYSQFNFDIRSQEAITGYVSELTLGSQDISPIINKSLYRQP
ncbi:hypothetical protein WN50_00710 [Limnoraphis robusta CS-951]|uniref:Uncharacterized protein n=1 Tax=Limnoraphis robusta CS-951 TaxID=1637645 RepID=A0A0F5YMB2_9CYAN|nr:hypothetical protein WN50_00710 [Limnoraphis robusta CS-951]